MAIMKALAVTKNGKTRKELFEVKVIGGGSALTRNLEELEQCGFIRRYTNYTKPKKAIHLTLVSVNGIANVRNIKMDRVKGYYIEGGIIKKI